MHPDNWDALRVFLALGTQWRWIAGPMGARAAGLDYAAIPPTLVLMGMAATPALFAQLRAMEGAALEVWSRRR
ncbi:MAG: DUF1799 domain-containing protein [Magnetospirillum sp. WYHS-4]